MSPWRSLARGFRALFRSRQQEMSIMQQPFSPSQLELLRADKVPPHPL